MRVKLAKHGGFAATIGHPEQIVDSGQLDPQQAAKLREAVKAAVAARPNLQATPKRAVPDAMTYTITVDEENQSTTLKSSDADMPPEFANLLEELERLMR